MKKYALLLLALLVPFFAFLGTENVEASTRYNPPVYRVYHPGLKVHHYTISEGEYNTLGTRGWKKEGIAWYSADSKVVSNGASISVVYRVYNPNTKKHLYTTDANEYAILSARGWIAEGFAFYSASNGTVPVYRLYHPGLKVHLYTKDKNEYNILAKRGWKQEGVAFRGYSALRKD